MFWNISIEDLKESVRKNFKEVRGTRKIIEGLRQKGYKLGLLSNHVKEWVEYCEEKLSYTSLFDVVSYSFEALVCKPDKEAFKIILHKLQSKPKQTLFIDDQPKNIKTAEELGIKSILFESAPQLKNDLYKFGIKIT